MTLDNSSCVRALSHDRTLAMNTRCTACGHQQVERLESLQMACTQRATRTPHHHWSLPCTGGEPKHAGHSA